MAVTTPGWLKNAVIYEVYIPGYSHSGDFDGVTGDLERIRGLGTDIVWLMPIHPIGEAGRKGTLGSPYSVKDYRAINQLLGNEANLKQLINKTHDLGMKLIIDVVFHHTSNDSVLIKEHPDWFVRDESGNIKRKIEDWSDISDLDYSKPELWDYLIESLQYWLEKGVDGFRCDVAPMVPQAFWNRARQVLNQQREVIWLAESVHKQFIKELRGRGFSAHSDPELHESFDLTYDYDGFEYLEDYFWGNREGLSNYVRHLFVQETLYPEHAIKLRFLENHDNPRIGSRIHDRKTIQNWVAFYTLLPGAILIYAGQEILTRKFMNFFERDQIDWENGDWEFNDYFKTVIKLSKRIKRDCRHFEIKELGNQVVLLRWKNDTEEYLGVVNLEPKAEPITLNLHIGGTNLLTHSDQYLSGSFAPDIFPVIIKVS
ncbi:MAG TPA: alpha-amylase family glycosyl hydrolase [Bacillota bacterium]|jgi:cyclomaltodextrinase|nr:alpha-amylase family glycosyl hydrolase [Bacillota bacterium]